MQQALKANHPDGERIPKEILFVVSIAVLGAASAVLTFGLVAELRWEECLGIVLAGAALAGGAVVTILEMKRLGTDSALGHERYRHEDEDAQHCAALKDPLLVNPAVFVSGTVQNLIGLSDGDCAPSPSHTTGRAVFRIRRLNPAVYRAARSDGIKNWWRRNTAFGKAL